MKTFRLIGMAFIAILVCLNLSSCKDDEGPSVNSLIGVWEGIESDSWSIVPGYEQNDEWWADRPEKDSQRGVDISDYRVEFNSDQFYRIYTYSSVDNVWRLEAVGKWGVSNNKITMVAYSGNEYDEENPSEFNILEHKDSKITLEYYKLTPASEKYGKLTLRQIATKDEMFDAENSGNSDIDIDMKVVKENPAKYVGTWLPVDGTEGFVIKADGTGYGMFKENDEWVSGEGYDEYRWFVCNDMIFLDFGDGDGFVVSKILSFNNDVLKTEFTGYSYSDELGFNDEFIEEAGQIIVYNKI